jgi:hypothetical protein
MSTEDYTEYDGSNIEILKRLTELGNLSIMKSHTSSIFIPSKHTKMSYAKQNRIAKAKRNNKQKRK